MPIRVQCDNCRRVYNLPDDNAGKRLRCKQCAVAFTVPAPAAAAPPAKPKICVVCNQNVAGLPRTKDNAGNYYCRPCYDEQARKHAMAQSRAGAPVPAGIGAGGGSGSDDGDMIDLAALEPEQFDESTQPPPPPNPNHEAPPIPDMDEPIAAEPIVVEAPRPKKKKKKKKAQAAAASSDSFMSKVQAMPLELWVVGLALILAGVGMLSRSVAPQMSLLLILGGLACFFWGKICLVMAAFAEDTTTGIRYMFFPFYAIFFILSNWSGVQRYVGRVALGIAIMIGGFAISVKHVVNDVLEGRANSRSDRSGPENLSTDPAYVIQVDLGEPPGEEGVLEKQVAAAIQDSFIQRGVKPPPGGKYQVEALVEEGASATDKISIPINGRELNMPAPMLTCKLRVKDAGGNVVCDKEGNIILDKNALLNAPKKKSSDGESFLEKQLWKNVVPQFKTLAADVPATPASGSPAP
jgi:hypothetical protein